MHKFKFAKKLHSAGVSINNEDASMQYMVPKFTLDIHVQPTYETNWASL